MKNILSSAIKGSITLCAAMTSILFSTQNAEAARGRPALNSTHTTFVADNGNRLRGPFVTTEWGDPPALADIQAIKSKGCNAIHLYGECFDANYPASGSTAPGYATSRIDQMVQMTRDEGLYLIITIGNGANNGSFNAQYVHDFWTYYAARYANETHVIFEIQNEPVAWSPPYSTAARNMELDAYNVIRSLAPNSPVLLFSYSVLSTGSDVLQDLAAIGSSINWSNAAIAVHGYAGADTTTTSLQQIIAAGYPCFMTEFCAATWGTATFNYDADLGTSLERLGVSWLSFQNLAAEFKQNSSYYDPITRAGLSWTPDYGTWPATRGVYGNNGLPRTTTGLTGTLRIEAEDYDSGGQGVAYNDADTANLGGQYRADGVDIEGALDTGGGYDVGWTNSGEWLEYTINVIEPGYYTLSLRVASTAVGSLRVLSGDVDLTGTWTLPNTGGWQTWTTVSQTVFLQPHQQRLRIEIINPGFNLNWIELSPISSGFLPNGTYKVVNRNSGKVIDVDGLSTADGAKIQQWGYWGGDNQKWSLTHLGANQYKLIGVQSAKTPNIFSVDNGAHATLSPYWGAGSEWQRFILTPTDSGNYRLRLVGSGLTLELESFSTVDGAWVQQWEYINATSQQWSFQSP